MRRRGYGIPYQGSKGAHAGRIYRCIAQRHPDARTLVDPFCGGWAVAHAFTRAGWTVQGRPHVHAAEQHGSDNYKPRHRAPVRHR